MLPKMEFSPEWLPSGYYWDSSSESNGRVEVRVENQAGDEGSLLVWFDEENGITFSIGGFLGKEDFLRMAGSVERTR